MILKKKLCKIKKKTLQNKNKINRAQKKKKIRNKMRKMTKRSYSAKNSFKEKFRGKKKEKFSN